MPIGRAVPKAKMARVLAPTNSDSHRSGTSRGSENSVFSPIKKSRALEMSSDATTTKVPATAVQNTVILMAGKEVVAIGTTSEVIPMVLDKGVPNKIIGKKRSGVECKRTGKRYLKFPEPSLDIVNVGIALANDKGKLIISPQKKKKLGRPFGSKNRSKEELQRWLNQKSGRPTRKLTSLVPRGAKKHLVLMRV
uniref:uncharacterized protein LOC105349886 n=1 Tax=Fragaria vesca subsp. vesca TaxID=101020 RepID=UPI0005CA0EB0|nr:PREDICTED: uncharacterized protein LOC105349886 [Fragaria vesca subsp. vesca]